MILYFQLALSAIANNENVMIIGRKHHNSNSKDDIFEITSGLNG